jgi:L-lactate utilization protein LutC
VAATRSIVAACAIAAVIATVGAALYVLGSPGEERVHLMDQRRVRDLQLIADAANLYWTRRGRLPATLAELAEQSAGDAIAAHDPASRETYGYRAVNDQSFELCAVFERDSSDDRSDTPAADFWSHKAGRQCFVVKVREIRR